MPSWSWATTKTPRGINNPSRRSFALNQKLGVLPWEFPRNTVRAGIIENLARTLELPPLVRSVVFFFCSSQLKENLLAIFFPLILNSRHPRVKSFSIILVPTIRYSMVGCSSIVSQPWIGVVLTYQKLHMRSDLESASYHSCIFEGINVFSTTAVTATTPIRSC